MPEGPVVDDPGHGDVSVENAPAVAAVHSFREGLGRDRTAIRAGLRGAARIDPDEGATGSCSLVVQHHDQLCPRGVVNLAREQAAREALDIQIFHCDAGELAGEIGGELVQHVGAPGRDSAIVSGEGLPRLAAPFRAALAACERPPTFTQGFGCVPGLVRPRDCLAGGQRDERGQAGVDTDGLAGALVVGRGLDVRERRRSLESVRVSVGSFVVKATSGWEGIGKGYVFRFCRLEFD